MGQGLGWLQEPQCTGRAMQLSVGAITEGAFCLVSLLFSNGSEQVSNSINVRIPY